MDWKQLLIHQKDKQFFIKRRKWEFSSIEEDTEKVDIKEKVGKVNEKWKPVIT